MKWDAIKNSRHCPQRMNPADCDTMTFHMSSMVKNLSLPEIYQHSLGQLAQIFLTENQVPVEPIYQQPKIQLVLVQMYVIA